MKRKTILFFLLLCFHIWNVTAQTVVEVKPLFEYPVAPENMESLEDKCNYLVKHFWDNFDFKKKESIDQYALNEAFGVYVTSMRYANGKEVDQSIDKLIGKLSGNLTLLIQFTKAAEENLYGPRADFWSDEIYLKFIDGILKNKKIAAARKTRYEKQANSIRLSAEGETAPSFKFIDTKGQEKNYFPMSTPTLLIIGNPEDSDWRLTRLKMESNFNLGDAIDKGKVNIIYIVSPALSDWEKSISNYNKKWTIGESKEISEKYDTRLMPSVYLIGSEGKILMKNVPIEMAVATMLEKVN